MNNELNAETHQNQDVITGGWLQAATLLKVCIKNSLHSWLNLTWMNKNGTGQQNYIQGSSQE